MRRSVFTKHASVIAIGLASLSSGAFAQDAEPVAEEEASALDEIVVTAAGGDKSRLNTAVAVTSVNSDLIDNFKPASESEIYRLIPGIQAAGTAGPGGNANIAIRGLPVATGGAPFLQLQEDGLPTVLFGDIQFGNNDYWTRYDASVERLESVRGGGATTFASQAPGAIINYISNTGKEAGGYIQGNAGINLNEYRLDFRYGAPIGNTTRFHIGGFYKTGHGPLNNFKVSDSIQIKANVTQDIGENGFIRVLLKYADTQEPNYTGAPALATRSGTSIGDFQPFPGFDGRTQSNYSSLNRTGLFYNRAGTLERQPINGITTKQFSIGGQLHYELGENFTIDDNMRWSDMSGHFASPFLNLSRTAGVIGSTVNGQTVAAIRYASGPRAGQLYTGTYIDNNVNVRTNMRDMGSFANNLALAGNFDMGGAKVTARGGLFYMKQDIAMDWHVNKSTREVSGNNPAQLNLFNAAGAALTVEGISGYNNNWGDCCARDYDLSYTNTAPYAALELDSDSFGLDASIRFERVKAEGGGRTGGAEFNVNSSGVLIPTITANGPAEVVNYTRSYKSWTIGGLYKINQNNTLFARASDGGRFNGDRQTFGGKFHKTGSTIGALCTSAQTELRNAANVVTRAAQFGCGSDGVTPSVDFVKQYEIGLKSRGDLGAGRYSFEMSLLKANFKQSTFELSATRCPGGAGGCIIDAKYKSSGAELYGTYEIGGFSLAANATYTKAKQLGSGATAYRRASYMPDLTYTLSTHYDMDMVGFGLSMTGQSSVRDDGGNVYAGGAIFNGNLSVRPIKHVEIGLNAYNLFNRLDFRGNGSNVADGGVTPIVVTGTPVIGRTISASAKFSF
jgi:outer membrane receptor protein involved in Fe transport